MTALLCEALFSCPAFASEPVSFNVFQSAPNQFDVTLDAWIEAPPAAVWKVLTDYNHHAEVLPHLRKSQIIGEDHGDKIVFQEGGLQILFWRFLIRVTQRVHERYPSEMDFESVEGTFKALRGTWQLKPSPGPAGATQLQCHFLVEPKSRVPAWAVRFTTRHYLAAMVRSLQTHAESR